jgi:hypothetical protein
MSHLALWPLGYRDDLSRNRIFLSEHLVFEDEDPLMLDIGSVTREIPSQMTITVRGDCGVEEIMIDKLGSKPAFAFAKELKKVKASGECPKNVAILAFIQAMPDNTPMILFWW